MSQATKAETHPPSSPAWSRVPDGVYLLTLCLVGGFLRYVMTTRSGIWRDEAQFIFLSRLPSFGEMLTFLREHESHPPLFYLIARLWQGVFGKSETAILLLPVLIGVLQIPSLYHVGSRLYNRTTGLIAAALGMLSPELVYFSSEVRPYSFLPIVTLFSTYFLWQRLQGRPGTLGEGLKAWLPYILTATVGLYTHNWFLFVFIAQTLFLAGYLVVLAKGSPGRDVWQRLGHLAIGPILTFILYLPWLPSLLYQTAHAGHTAGELPLDLLILRLPLGSTIGALEAPNSLLIALVVLIPALIGGVLSRRTQEKTKRLSPFPLLALLPIVLYVCLIPVNHKTSVLFDRCVEMLAPLVYLALASGYVSLGKKQSWLPLAPLLVAWAVYGYTLVLLFPNAKSNARDAAALLVKSAQPSDVVVLAPEWIASDINFYYRGTLEEYCYPNPGRSTLAPFNDIRLRYGDKESLAKFKEYIAQLRAKNRRVWLVISLDHLAQLLQMPAVPEDYDMIADSRFTPGAIATARVIQIAHALSALYGPPLTKYDKELPRRGRYDYALLLFDPATKAGQP